MICWLSNARDLRSWKRGNSIMWLSTKDVSAVYGLRFDVWLAWSYNGWRRWRVRVVVMRVRYHHGMMRVLRRCRRRGCLKFRNVGCYDLVLPFLNDRCSRRMDSSRR